MPLVDASWLAAVGQAVDRHELLDHGIDLLWDFELDEMTGPGRLADGDRRAGTAQVGRLVGGYCRANRQHRHPDFAQRAGAVEFAHAPYQCRGSPRGDGWHSLDDG